MDLKNFLSPRLFITDHTENISFKLETLKLNNVYFADKAILKTQTGLKTIDTVKPSMSCNGTTIVCEPSLLTAHSYTQTPLLK